MQAAHTLAQIVVGHELRMFARDEEQISKPLLFEGSTFPKNFIDGQGHAKNGVITGEAAIAAVVNAFVREIEWRKEADDLSKALAREHLGTEAEGIQEFAGGR